MALWRYDRDTESTRWRHPSRRRDFRFATPSVRDRAFGQDRGDPPFPSDSGYQRNPRAGAPSTLVVTIASMLPPHMVRDRCQPPAPWGDPRRLWLARSRDRQLRIAIGHRTSVGVSEAATCASAVHTGSESLRRFGDARRAFHRHSITAFDQRADGQEMDRRRRLRGRPRRRKRRSRAVRLVPVNELIR